MTTPDGGADRGAADDPLDVLGVGFGPANLALAIALAESVDPAGGARSRFVERQARFGWHRGMLFDDATMQVSFLKDLVTLRNPVSRFGFLSYLHARGRMADFINYRSVYPLRTEFHDYLEWAAAPFAGQVDYGHRVTSLAAVPGRDDVVVARADVPDGIVEYHARNVVLATGLVPRLPRGVRAGARVWHSAELLTRHADLPPGSVRTAVVVGAGQSAAECAKFLHDSSPSTQVHAVFARYGYSPSDDSAFVNGIFDAAAVDDFHGAPPEVRKGLLDYHRNTNYAVVDNDLIEDLYRLRYRERLSGDQRLHVHRSSRLAVVTDGPHGVRVVIESASTGDRQVVDADLLVYATGYLPSDPVALLGDLAEHCVRDDDGQLCVERDYRIRTSGPLRVGLYLQGASEHTHGLSSTLLSSVAVRAGEISSSLAVDRSGAARVSGPHHSKGSSAT